MDKPALLALADRVEAGDKVGDDEIALISGLYVYEKRGTDRKEWFYPTDGVGRKRGFHGVFDALPRFLHSIEAATMLIPKGLVINMSNDTAFCWAHVWDDAPDYNGEVFNPYEGHAETLPPAITAAALRARAEGCE